MILNLEAYNRLTNNSSDSEVSKKINISRQQVWRAKNGNNVGIKFIENFTTAYNVELKDYFF